MKKPRIENLNNSLPSLMTSLGSYMKSLVSLDNKKDLIDSASGSIGFLIQLFGKPIIDNFFKSKLKIS